MIWASLARFYKPLLKLFAFVLRYILVGHNKQS